MGCSQGQAVGCSQVASWVGGYSSSAVREGGGEWRWEADPAEDVDPLSALCTRKVGVAGRGRSATV